VSPASPEETIWTLLRGALTARAVGVVADLDVAEALAAGPRPVAELAAETGADPETLYRFLRALASDGVFEELEPRIFRNTPASELIAQSGWKDFAQLFGDLFYRGLGSLDSSGEPSFERELGTDFWTWLADHSEERARFDGVMEQGKEARVERFAPLEWRGDETVVDVGGGNGSLLAALLDLEPGLRGIVLDLPETVRDEEALGERIAFVAGDFFERVPEGDAYVLSTILHDGDDDRAAAILRTIHAAAPPGARLLILDAVVDAGNDPSGAKWLDLLMLALAGGKERSETQWRTLLAAGGFEPVRFHEGLIEAVPAG
jgi:DNA-binding Lrp family transcriptional regulator